MKSIEKNIVLRVKNIYKRFPGVQALNNVSIELARGEVHAVVGENGAGKSTLMKIIFGSVSVDSGDIYLDGEKVDISRPRDSLDLGISMIFQEISLIPDISIAENLFIDRLPKKIFNTFVDWKKLYKESEELLDTIGISINPRLMVKELSTAQQQLVEIARALSAGSKIVIMDEPTSSISISEIEKLFKIIESLKKKGVSIIYISHKLDEVFKIADRVTVLRDGELTGTFNTKDVDKDKLINLMVGRHVKELYFRKRDYSKGDKVAIKVENLNKKGFFEDIDFSVRSNEILGVYGLIGSGRTELALTIFGFLNRTSGKIYINGKEVFIKSPVDAISNGIVYMPEDRKGQSIIPRLSVKNNITISSLKRCANLMFIINKMKEFKTANKYVERLKISTPTIHKDIVELSGGNQQKVIIARILAMNPSVIILDEPTKGIDVGAKAEVHLIIKELSNSGIGIILISSEMPEILSISDRVITMRDGKITGELSKSEMNEDSLLRAASY